MINTLTTKVRIAVLLGVVTGAHLTPSTRAQETNTLEVIKQLQQRIDQLEQKVQRLEREKSAITNSPAPNSAQKLEELDQKVRTLERDRELAAEANLTNSKAAPKISIGEEGFSLGSANGDFSLQLKGVLQVDSRTFFSDAVVGNDGFLLRRARPILQGTLFRDFDFMFVPDFGGTGSPQIFDAYLNYRYSAALQLQGGKFKSPVGLEQLVSDRDLLFNERSLATALVPNRDLGFELHGDLWDGTLSYAAGIFNGVGDGRNSNNADFEDDKAFAGRLFVRPFKKLDAVGLKGLGFGLGGSYESMQTTNTSGLPQTTGGSLPGFVTDGQQQFFAYNPASVAGKTPVVLAAGDHWRLSPQGYYYWGPFGLLGEYVISDQKVTRTVAAPFKSARLDNTAWEISGSWVLTGEDAAYAGGVIPRHPFKPAQGEWGALQLVARYGQLHLDDAAFPIFADPATSANSAAAWSVGLNWYLNRNLQLKMSYSHTTFSGGGGTSDRKAEDVLFTRMQLAF